MIKLSLLLGLSVSIGILAGCPPQAHNRPAPPKPPASLDYCGGKFAPQKSAMPTDCGALMAVPNSSLKPINPGVDKYQHAFPSGKQVIVREGSLLTQPVEAIVNAANSQLRYGGGVAQAIKLASGEVTPPTQPPTYLVQRLADQALAACGVTQVPTADAVITGSENLMCIGISWIINAVGPVCATQNVMTADEAALLQQAIRNVIKRAEENNIASVAIPPVSANIFRCGHVNVTPVIAQEVVNYLANNSNSPINTIVLVDIGQQGANLFAQAAQAAVTALP